MRKRVGGKNSKFRGSEVRKKVVWRAGGRGMGNKGRVEVENKHVGIQALRGGGREDRKSVV